MPHRRGRARPQISDLSKLERLRQLTEEMEGLAGKDGDLSEQEEDRFAELTHQFEDVATESQLERLRALHVAGQVEDGTSFGDRPRPTLSREGGEARRTIDGAARSGLLPDHAAEVATRLVEQGPALNRSLAARWATTTGSEHYLRAFTKLLSDPERGHLLWTAEEGDAYRAVAQLRSEMRAMSLTDASGGYMVPLTLDPAIMLTSAGSINPLRRISRVVQTVTDTWQGVSSAGVTAEWKAEAAQVADASPTLASPSIPVHFGDAFVPYSFEVGMDAVDFLGELQRVLVDGADQLMNTAYTTGTGTGQPKGIITALVGTASIVTGAEAFPNANVYAVQNALPPRFSARAQWAANIAVINLMSQKETAAGARLFPEIGEGRLLNKPLNELSNMDGVIDAAQENYILLYGDFQAGFVIVDRIGTTLELIPNLVGAAFRPTGQRGALLWFRTGSDAPVINAFRLLNAT